MGRGARLAHLLSNAWLPACAVLWATAAAAQDTPPPGNPPAVAKTATRFTGIESVTTTARKKEERQIDVPVSSAVMPAEVIERYSTTDLTQLTSQTPGVRIDRAAGGTPGAFIYIRGIGVFGPDYASEQPVSIVIDGVPIGRGHIVDSGFFDQSAIQILKGPQSLFFGKNTPAGVIAIDSVSPEVGAEPEGYARASYGINWKDPTLEAAMSFPVSDKVAMRIAVRGEAMQGGWMKNEVMGRTVTPAEFPDPFYTGPTELPGRAFKVYPKTKQLLGRLTTVFKPSDNFDATLKLFASYYRDNSSSGASAVIHCDGAHPHYADLLTGILYEDTSYECGFHRRSATSQLSKPIMDNFIDRPESEKFFTLGKNYLASLKMNLVVGDFTVTSVTGLYLLRASQFDNYDFTVFAETPDHQRERTRSFTQEIHAVSDFDGPVNVTVGAFYEDEHRILHNTNRIFLLPPYPDPASPYFGASNTMIDYDINNAWSVSAFGEVTWEITSSLELAGGARWTLVRKDTHVTQPFEWLTLFGAGNPFAPTGADYHVQVREDNWSPQVTLTWHPTDDLTLYGAYRTGFLAGGIGNPGVVSNYTGFTEEQLHNALAFDSEKAEGFEVGIKGQFLDGRISGDLALFRYKYKGLQVATFHPETTSFSIGNAASAINQGVEGSLSAQVTPEFSTRVSFSYVDLHYVDYANAPCYSGQTEALGCIPTPTPHQDLSGEDFGIAPFNLIAGFTYDVPISDTFNISLTGDVSYANKGNELNRQPNTAVKGHTQIDASLRVYQPDGPWEFAVIGTNLTNMIYATTIGGKPLGSPLDLTGVINRSREVRLQVTRRF
jgi:outer membrane receptor protein involved in Fe transport